MEWDNDNIRGDNSLENYTLESILAEYKGSAYIDGDKKTPAHILNEQAEKIILEVTGDNTSGALLTSEHGNTDASDIVPEEAGENIAPEILKPAPVAEMNEGKHTGIPDDSVATDEDILFFDNFQYSSQETAESVAEEVEQAVEKLSELEEETKGAVKKTFGLFGRGRRFSEDGGDFETHEEAEEEPVYEEPELREAVKWFAAGCNSISLRYTAALLVSIIMAVITFTVEAGWVLPFGISENPVLAIGVLLMLQLLVMLLGVDLLIRGARDLLRGAPNAETLALFSCAFSIISGAFSIAKDGGPAGLPYSVVSAFSVVFMLLGEKYSLRAMTETLKTAVTSLSPYAMIAEYRSDIDRSVLKKSYGKVEGFYNNLMHPDISELAYRYAAPLLIAAALILSVFTSLTRDMGEYFMHILSALFAASASFSAIIAFSAPFYSIARSARKSGAAIAGWGGADDIFYTDGSCITDDDLFPQGTLSLNGVKIFEEVSPEKAIRYTASLIIASGSGIARVFSEVLTKQGMSLIKVEDFACYEGGIGALIRGERVMTGSAAFMNLLGIRVPDDMNMKNAVFTAVNDKLIAMFAINYAPVNSVQNALVSILKWRIKLFFAVRDFNITPLMLEQKFKVSLDDIEYIPTQNSYSISDENAESSGRTAALLTREGLGPFGEAVTGGRLLRTAALAATAVSVVTAVLGVLFMFFLCWEGAFESARPGNLLVFMLSMLAAVLVVCGYVRCKK